MGKALEETATGQGRSNCIDRVTMLEFICSLASLTVPEVGFGEVCARPSTRLQSGTNDLEDRTRCVGYYRWKEFGCPHGKPRSVGCRRFCTRRSTQVQQNSTCSTISAQKIQRQSLKQQNPKNFNRPSNLVRDQGVGGSNPPSPNPFRWLDEQAREFQNRFGRWRESSDSYSFRNLLLP